MRVGNLITLKPFHKRDEIFFHLQVYNLAACVATEMRMTATVTVETAERIIDGKH